MIFTDPICQWRLFVSWYPIIYCSYGSTAYYLTLAVSDSTHRRRFGCISYSGASCSCVVWAAMRCQATIAKMWICFYQSTLFFHALTLNLNTFVSLPQFGFVFAFKQTKCVGLKQTPYKESIAREISVPAVSLFEVIRTIFIKFVQNRKLDTRNENEISNLCRISCLTSKW